MSDQPKEFDYVPDTANPHKTQVRWGLVWSDGIAIYAYRPDILDSYQTVLKIHHNGTLQKMGLGLESAKQLGIKLNDFNQIVEEPI